jgi:predicted DNA-binding protein YlxM (UPF0122 family)
MPLEAPPPPVPPISKPPVVPQLKSNEVLVASAGPSHDGGNASSDATKSPQGDAQHPENGQITIAQSEIHNHLATGQIVVNQKILDDLVKTDVLIVRSALRTVGDTLSVREAATALTHFNQQNTDLVENYVTSNAMEAFNTLLTRVKGTNGQPLILTPDETKAITTMFTSFQEKLPRLSNDQKRGEIVSGLHSLLNRNPELVPTAQPAVEQLLLQNTDVSILRLTIRIVEDTFSVHDAAIALTHFNQQNTDFAANYLTPNTLDSFDAVLTRRRGTNGQPIVLNPEETQAITTMFTSFQEKLPRVQAIRRQENLVTSIHNLLNSNPELTQMAETLANKINQLTNETLVEKVARHTPSVPVYEVHTVIRTGRAYEASTAIDRYQFLHQLLRDLPKEQQQTIRAGLDRFTQGEEGASRRNLLQTIFSNDESAQLDTALRRNSIELSRLPEVLNDEAVLNLVSIMLDAPDKYRFQIGTILSQIPINNIPEPLRQRLKPIISDSEMKILTGHDRWWLCGQAEPRLQRSIANQAVVLVNDQLLAKFIGKFSALCLNTFTTNTGQTFLAGNWYSPTDGPSRDAIRHAFDTGNAKLTLGRGDWAIMRPLAECNGMAPEQFLDQIRHFSSELPDKLPDTIRGTTKRQYREANSEEG